MRLKIITPEKIILDTEVNQVTVPTESGVITILQDHADLLSNLSLGNITFKTSEKNEDFITIESGFLSTDGKDIKILADIAMHSKDFEEEKLSEIKSQAEEIIKNAPVDANIEKLKAETRIVELHLTSKKKRRI